mgnify:CR=1 FL=1
MYCKPQMDLSDETVTTALKEGDVLYGHLWKVDSITTCDGALEDVWCVEEPVTHSFYFSWWNCNRKLLSH